MIDWAKESMQDWAARRGLHYTETGLLGASTPALAAALGAGSHRAGLVRSDTRRGFTATGGFTVRPERSTHNLCSGTLPGGADGVVAHHVSLVCGYGSDDQAWNAVPETVVVVRVPAAVRVTRWLSAMPLCDAPSVRSLIGGQVTLVHRAGVVDAAGWHWRADADAVGFTEFLDADTQARLAELPDRTAIELSDGTLCLTVRGVVQDGETLDRLCAVASGVTRALERAAGTIATLDAEAALPPAGLSAEIARVTWPVPPASVTVAQAAYAAELRAVGSLVRCARRGALRAALASIGAAMLSGAAFDGLGLGLPGAAAGALFALLIIGPGTLAAEVRRGRRVAERDIAARSGLWGLDAFAAGYARSHGLTLEDRDALRRAFPAPMAGVPLRVWRGELAPGLPGRLALWIDATDRSRSTYGIVAITPFAGAAPVIEGYRTAVRDGQLVAWAPVAAEDRSATRLDALRSAVAISSAAATRSASLR